MQANKTYLKAILEKKMCIEVPLFQRPYTWSQEHQWEPLWEDIAHKFDQYISGENDTTGHFLGAMVLDQMYTQSTHVEKRQIVDGQQRLTTMQIFISAFRDFCHEQGERELAEECEKYVRNQGMMHDRDREQFKIYPTEPDRKQFADVILSGSKSEIENRYPPTRRKYARKVEARPRMIEAYLFFHSQITQFFNGSKEENVSPKHKEKPIRDRLEACFQAIGTGLEVVLIDLEKNDEAQVIFETLNARGTPLLPTDLIKNYIFRRTEDFQKELYDQYWKEFDSKFWRGEIKQGRLKRPRSDLFMQHYLSSQTGNSIPIKHLYIEYKNWIERNQPFESVKKEIEAIHRLGGYFREIVDPQVRSSFYEISMFLKSFDIGTVYPFLIAVMESQPNEEARNRISTIIESYLVRRYICGQTPKNYNLLFLELTKKLRDGLNVDKIGEFFMSKEGPSNEWPNDTSFKEAWCNNEVYSILRPKIKIEYILKKLNDAYRSDKSENIHVDGKLTIEHILPQNWIENWPLPNSGLSEEEFEKIAPQDPNAAATKKRNSILHTLGNLTLLTQKLNSSVSNGRWNDKKKEILLHSALPINRYLQDIEAWNEEEISNRSEKLFQLALELWPYG